MLFNGKKLDSNLRILLNSKTNSKYRVIIKYKKFEDNLIKKISKFRGEFINNIKHCNIITARLDSKSIKRLIEYPEVEYICFDEYLFLCGISVATANKVKISSKSKLNGTGVTIAIIDSGVYPHPDLISPSNRITKFVDLLHGLSYPYDDNGHGTSIAGVIVGNGEKSNGLYKGVATKSNIHSYKAFDKSGKGYFSDILFSIDMIVNDNVNNEVKVICMPFEMLHFNNFLQKCFYKLINLAYEDNITCIIPSGSNKNYEGSITGVALCPNCITVSGYDSTSGIKPYCYSSAGNLRNDSKPNLTAACVDIVSLNSNISYISERDGIKLYPKKLDSSYKAFTGTSLSAAYVSGICALLYEYDNSLTPKDISSLLKLSCEPLDIPANLQGNGKVNINNIIK
ncbi:S8 family serine peptidase [Clostridium sp.]|uniref:S8 family serine peptidase n=1 Tax=Clostridium sp. TaxID=1506 RepID=UPI00261CC0F8|nr:S8 family serine peptidase [Clostridium sp.]